MSAGAQINWDDDAKSAPQIKWDEEPAAAKTATTPAATTQPSTWEKLTRGVNPSLDEFSAKHPVAGPIVRGLDAAGGALIGTIPSIASSIVHPVDTANAVGQSIEDWTTHPKDMARGIPSVLPELVGQNVGGAAAIGGAGEAIGTIPKITSGAATRVLRGPGGYGDIQSPAGHFPGLIRELESRVPRNEPPTARGEMYEDLGARRAARGEEQARLDAQNEARLRETEQARQKELADQERLKEQDARARMQRKETIPQMTPYGPTKVNPEHIAELNPEPLPTRIPKVGRGMTFEVPIPERQAAIPNVGAATPFQEFNARQATIPSVSRTGSAQEPFEPLIYASPEEAAQNDLRMANLKRQASAAGTYHAAQGGTGRATNLQQRIGRKFIPNVR